MTTEPAGAPGDADADLSASLRALSQSYPELPAAVAQRLDRTLAELPDLSAPDTAPAPAPVAKPPWWRRRYALASAGLAVVAFLGGGLLFAAQPWQNTGEGASSAADKQEGDTLDKFNSEREGGEKDDSAPGEEPSIHTEVEPYIVTYSNRDYRESDLTDARDASTSVDKAALPAELFPLASSEEMRDGCVVAASSELGGTVTSVDFGRFEGEPAMIAVVEADSGDGGTVAALGTGCSVQDPDLLGSADF